MARSGFDFEVNDAGALFNSAANVEALRALWLDRFLVAGDDLGPGDRGDFAFGAWHSACHLFGAGGVKRAANGAVLWFEISHDSPRDDYYASVTVERRGVAETLRLDSAPGRALAAGSKLLGFIEGTSLGRISARDVNDPPDRFNMWRRQDFDQPIDSPEDGGRVWEHWCTLRDIRPTARIGTAVLAAYVSLVAELSDLFVATVARGRREYGHPVQLAAMVHAGFVSQKSAVADLNPQPLPPEAEKLLLEGDPGHALQAASKLDWTKPPRYYMFKRKIKGWSPASAVRADIKAFKP